MCRGKRPILVRYTYPEEVTSSIRRNIRDKRAMRGNQDYTVIYASGGRSVKISVAPERMKGCSLRAIPVLNPDKNMIKYL